MLRVYLVFNTFKREVWSELKYVAAKSPEDAVDLVYHLFDYGDIPRHVEETEMFAEGSPRVVDSMILG